MTHEYLEICSAQCVKPSHSPECPVELVPIMTNGQISVSRSLPLVTFSPNDIRLARKQLRLWPLSDNLLGEQPRSQRFGLLHCTGVYDLVRDTASLFFPHDFHHVVCLSV